MADLWNKVQSAGKNFGNTLKGAADDIKNTWNNEIKNLKGINIGDGINTDLTDQLVPKPKVLAEKILKSKTISCSITLPDPIWDGANLIPNTITIPFYMSSDFSFGVSNKWTQLISQDGAFETFKFALDTLSVFSGQSQVSLQSQAMSSATWKGSEFTGFNLNNCIFICTNRHIDPTNLIYKLCKACLPTKHKDFKGNASGGLAMGKSLAKGVADFTGGMANLLTLDNFKEAVDAGVTKSKELIEDLGMVAPFGYGVVMKDGKVTPIKGTTCTLQIGDWFCAGDLVVEGINGITFSKELVAPARIDNVKSKNDLYDPTAQGINYGFPLYATCSMVLKPYCIVDVEMFTKYFKTANKMNVININNLFNL